MKMNLQRLKTDPIGAWLVFLTTLIVFLFSPVRHLADSKFSMLLSERLLSNHRFSLDRRALPSIPPKEDGEILAQGKNIPYQIELVRGKFYYWYPPGTSILSIPYVAAMNAIGVSATDRNGVYNEAGDTTLQAGLAALLMAGLALITFYTSRLLLPFGLERAHRAGHGLRHSHLEHRFARNVERYLGRFHSRLCYLAAPSSRNETDSSSTSAARHMFVLALLSAAHFQHSHHCDHGLRPHLSPFDFHPLRVDRMFLAGSVC